MVKIVNNKYEESEFILKPNMSGTVDNYIDYKINGESSYIFILLDALKKAGLYQCNYPQDQNVDNIQTVNLIFTLWWSKPKLVRHLLHQI